ncbi:mannitol-specific phosphotransferase system IIBC component [Polaromonas sp. CG_9.5]|uniref:hypothetical protein n=1 Tax=Polaromonas sp. CG_9.5 TaxID=3071705 RepID=UPI002DFD261F|nr:mannitol-specific phosphotransferase system IIBC component [Polaromonas sp. CG_9.5]
MEIETSSMVLLAASGAVSFALGRVFVHFRDKKRKKAHDQAQQRAAQALRDQPPEPESKNKSKRKRQLQQQEKNSTHLPR